MSDPYTSIEAEHGGLGEWGHIEPAEAIERLRAHYEHEAEKAAAVLADVDAGNVRVFHQIGPWAMRNRRCVYPSSDGAK